LNGSVRNKATKPALRLLRIERMPVLCVDASKQGIEAMSDDTHLQLSVLAELEWEPRITAAHIGVSADGGVVTLSGQLESFVQKHAAELAVLRVAGVRAVANNLKVEIPFEHRRKDKDIAAAIVERLAWDASIPRNAIKAAVEGGWTTLTGEVEWNYQRKAAEKDVQSLHGVVGVSNNVLLRQRPNSANISNDISIALNRSFFSDRDAITVTAEAGNVRLTGKVHSWHDRQVAADTAWGAPGTAAVENLLAVIE
jgi:osmotically-inducible protein OsmY